MFCVHPKNTYTHTSPKNVWSSNIEYVENCSEVNNKILIQFSGKLHLKIQDLMKIFSDLEWLGYLIGGKVDNGYYFTDILIPKQVVDVASVKVEENEITTPFVIHSHGSFTSFNHFSNTDDEYINENNDVSILIAGKKLSGEVRVKTPCGKWFRTSSLEFKIEHDKIDREGDNYKDFIKDIKNNVRIRREFVKVELIDISKYRKMKKKGKKGKGIPYPYIAKYDYTETNEPIDCMLKDLDDFFTENVYREFEKDERLKQVDNSVEDCKYNDFINEELVVSGKDSIDVIIDECKHKISYLLGEISKNINETVFYDEKDILVDILDMINRFKNLHDNK
jgi:hypothetical protein